MLAIFAAILMSVGQPMRPPFVQPVVRATGVGYPPMGMQGPQARLMAQRAAEVNAVRNLSNMLGGGPRAYLSGFHYVSRAKRADGSFEVTVEARVLPASRR